MITSSSNREDVADSFEPYSRGALDGIKVIDLTRVLAGPYCTMILGDLGADVIKIEAPGGSDETRGWGPPNIGGESAYYLCTNRNKRALTLDLKNLKARDILRELLKDADVVINNFKTGTMEKWGLGYETMAELNPRLIYVSISGFGQTGPYKHVPGYDYIVQAMGGMMSITGSEETGPMKVGVAIADVATGLYAAIGILAALRERDHSGMGQMIDLALFDSQISLLVNVASNYLVSGQIPKRYGNQHPNIVPYQTFAASDMEMVVAVGNDQQFRRLCVLLGKEEWSRDPKFATNSARLVHREEICELLQEEFKKRPASEWLVRLTDVGVPNAPIYNLAQLFEDPQVQARKMKVEISHPTAGKVSMVGSPLKLSRTPVSIRRHPPLVGEHTKEILLAHGFTEEQIDEWFQDKII
ncbi:MULTISPECIES: CaiB/BaiF CoA transferase family protein [Aneurinibacillus]|uniref:CoA transferase n=1 Tax=Aneurinibacillus thermoaerophilus TaxID=143495 RepID=A0A1G8A4V8_ANETH|nr:MULTISPECIES: CoA transferase [Aneurinibacillus]AMA74109.1 CoA-transferase [Aneurinibacillus sp. XH2]MED0736715.1 CoA transferase [Aneurinibacillus thermoaerophilus]MED0758370.1 CoA transferase [Aneurinibacillus thermoaerophilus]MED0759823.1 CoA transferase [Aneurinibacillus thermoaerophilus]QYY43307.1 CoA transferase [Aneurinibacillus thermoaerophilus]